MRAARLSLAILLSLIEGRYSVPVGACLDSAAKGSRSTVPQEGYNSLDGVDYDGSGTSIDYYLAGAQRLYSTNVLYNDTNGEIVTMSFYRFGVVPGAVARAFFSRFLHPKRPRHVQP